MALVDRVLINNLCSWPLYFKRANGVGDVRIPANAKNYSLLDIEEVRMQIQLDNKMFTGTHSDRQGDHPRLFIVDDKIRKELFNIADDEADDFIVLNADSVAALLAVKTKKEFNDRLQVLVKTDAEKKMVAQIAKEVGGDDVAAWKMEAINALAESVSI